MRNAAIQSQKMEETTAKLTKQLRREPHPIRTPQQAKESIIKQDSTHIQSHTHYCTRVELHVVSRTGQMDIYQRL